MLSPNVYFFCGRVNESTRELARLGIQKSKSKVDGTIDVQASYMLIHVSQGAAQR